MEPSPTLPPAAKEQTQAASGAKATRVAGADETPLPGRIPPPPPFRKQKERSRDLLIRPSGSREGDTQIGGICSGLDRPDLWPACCFVWSCRAAPNRFVRTHSTRPLPGRFFAHMCDARNLDCTTSVPPAETHLLKRQPHQTHTAKISRTAQRAQVCETKCKHPPCTSQ